jgi:transposase
MFLRAGVSVHSGSSRASRRPLRRGRELKTVEQRIQRGLVDFDVRRIRCGRRGKRKDSLVETLRKHAYPRRIGEKYFHELMAAPDKNEERPAARLVPHTLANWASPVFVDIPTSASMRLERPMARRKRRKFTDEFKADAVKLCEAGGHSVGRIAADLDLTETALRAWVKRAAMDAGRSPSHVLATPERDELTELRKRVKRLEMEREILI